MIILIDIFMMQIFIKNNNIKLHYDKIDFGRLSDFESFHLYRPAKILYYLFFVFYCVI